MSGTISNNRSAKAALGVLLVASTLTVMAGAAVAPVLALIQNDLGLSATAAGFIITTHGLTIALCSPFVGRLVDSWGVRGPLTVGLVVYGLGGGLGTVATTYPVLIASRVVLGLGAAMVFTATTVALLDLYAGGERRDRLMGWRTTAITIGGVVWPLFSGVLGEVSWHAAFAVYLVGLPLALAVFVSVPRTANSVRTPEPVDPVAAVDPEPHPEPVDPHPNVEAGVAEAPRPAATRQLLGSRAMLGLLGVVLVSGVMMYVPAVFLPKRLEQIGIQSAVVVAIYAVVLASVAASLIGLCYARLRTRFDHAVIMRLAAGSWALGLLIYGCVGQPVILLIAPVLIGAGNALAMPTLTVLVADRAPLELRGRATSLLSTAIFAGQFLSPLLVGPLIAATSYQVGFLAAAVLAAVVLVAVSVTRVAATS